MEAYKTTCPDCGHIRFWMGYKTGIGKSPEQLAQMSKDSKTCKKCGLENAITELDFESGMGKTMSAGSSAIANTLKNKINTEK